MNNHLKTYKCVPHQHLIISIKISCGQLQALLNVHQCVSDKGIIGVLIFQKCLMNTQSLREISFDQFFLGSEGGGSTSLLCTCIIPKERARLSMFSMIHVRVLQIFYLNPT